MRYYLYTLGADRVLRKVVNGSGVQFSSCALKHIRAMAVSMSKENPGVVYTHDIHDDLDMTIDGKPFVEGGNASMGPSNTKLHQG